MPRPQSLGPRQGSPLLKRRQENRTVSSRLPGFFFGIRQLMASDRMLRGRSPWGLGGAVYLLVRLFVRSCLFVDIRSLMLSIGVFGDVIENYLSMLDRTGALDRLVQQSSYYREPTVVVFKISPSENFSLPPGPVRTLCDISALALDLNFEDQICSRYRVQVQSPILTALINTIQYKIITLYIPSYILYYLQPLDISYYLLLKASYSYRVAKLVYKGIYYIDKKEFLALYI